LRLAALLPIVALFRMGSYGASAILFVAAMLTDCIDGWLARRFNRRTSLGIYLDPVVDKIVVIALLYELARAGLLSTLVAHLFLAREFLHNAIRAAAAQQGTLIGANRMGKTKAALQTALITVGLAMPGCVRADHSIYAAYSAGAWTVLALSWVFFGVFARRNRKALSG